jgi:hypothetical protein
MLSYYYDLLAAVKFPVYGRFTDLTELTVWLLVADLVPGLLWYASSSRFRRSWDTFYLSLMALFICKAITLFEATFLGDLDCLKWWTFLGGEKSLEDDVAYSVVEELWKGV